VGKAHLLLKSAPASRRSAGAGVGRLSFAEDSHNLMNILVTGAAGYIGSVVTERLVEDGHTVVAFDSLLHGHRDAVHPSARFVLGDLLDRGPLFGTLREARVEAVVHLAAEALIDESVRDPGRFFRVNVTGGLNLLDAMIAAGVRHLIFSSTAAVYGEPVAVPIPEDAPARPVNAYGESKLAFERALAWYQRAHGLRHVSLRYFNACGATERCGERHAPETHLIPLVLDVALGRREAIHLFGHDYDTPDGTCIRDYVHVRDIADAHIRCLEHLDRLEPTAFNLGNGTGYSNREVVAAAERVTGRRITVIEAPRRTGDPARLVADAQRISRDVGWHPAMPGLEDMIATAWAWHLKLADGVASGSSVTA
jgi:UDP-glucose 4-epimerase